MAGSLGGAPLGNKNGAKGFRWQAAIDRALSNRCKSDGIKELDRLAEAYLDAVEEMAKGNALRGPSIAGFADFADRMDGKPKQSIDAQVGLTGNIAAMIDMSGLSDDDIANLKASLGNAKFKDSPEAK